MDDVLCDYSSQIREDKVTYPDKPFPQSREGFFRALNALPGAIDSVNELRAKIFWKRLRKDGKVVDLSLLPPCSSTLRKHTARAHFIAKMWKLASYPLQHLDSFEDNG